jgi:class 3 adenylate cyclase/TolB-like protein/cytochrome c-type biogenesis protein CcmH/NrfG
MLLHYNSPLGGGCVPAPNELPPQGSNKPASLRRKLTTILIADVAGYSRLMGVDEEGTHARVAALFGDLLVPAVTGHGGTCIKTTGDGFLAEFESVVQAVRCAIEIQQRVAERNVGVIPDQKIAFRIGVNLGDVIVEADDIFGDGVNVAARLQGLARPGGIVVSRSVRDHVRDRLKLDFEDMGEQVVKNIARPVRAFHITIESGADRKSRSRVGLKNAQHIMSGAATLAAAIVIGCGWWFIQVTALGVPTAMSLAGSSTPPGSQGESASQLSIVVLPFWNLGGDPQQDYFVDGITQSLTTDLSRALPGSFVVARGTAFTYKGMSVDARQVARDLHVRYVLEGSVIPDGDRVRVNVQLIEAETNIELWAERFDSTRKGLLDIQDQIVGRLSRAVGLQLVDIEAKRSARERPVNPTALDLVMRGQAVANRPATPQTMIAARTFFQGALEHDPENVDALAGLAATYLFEVLNSYYDSGREERLHEAKDLIRRALEIEPRHIVALKIQAAALRAEGRFEEAVAASQAVIAQNPGEPWSYKEVGLSQLYLGRFEEALIWFEKADQIGPRDPSRWIWLGASGRVQFFRGRDEEAIRMLRLSASANPNDPRAYAFLASIYALSGRKDEASAALAACLSLRPDMTITRLFRDWSVPLQATSPAYQQQHERFRAGLRLAGMPET